MVNVLNISEFNKRLYPQNMKLIMREYKDLISEFVIHITASVTLHNKCYYEFIIKRGLDTLLHCFKMLLLYTKNIGIVSYYCKKALCYYVEFIGQIAQDSNSYLQLNTKDAILFVYKKTIFEIDSDFRKNYAFNLEEAPLFELITLNAEINNILVMNQLKFKNKDTMNSTVIANIINGTELCFDKLNSNEPNIKNNLVKGELVRYFINIIFQYCDNSDKYIEMCGTFIKKLKNKEPSISKLNKCFYMNNCRERFNSLTTLKFINWVFQQST